MFDLSKNRKQAINYNTVLDLLGYSQKKLRDLEDHWDTLIFSDSLVSEKPDEVAGLLECSVEEVEASYGKVISACQKCPITYSIITIKDDVYPSRLRKVSKPPLFLFTRGVVELTETPCVSVVGSRQASDEGRRRAQKLAMLLTKNGYTVVSGLAKGIDAAAQTATIKCGGKTIGVIGTAINESYPKENAALQEKIGAGHLLVSQFPLAQPTSRYNFPARNYTMAGLSLATVIVEASETSGALYQARYCLQEGRKLFVMKSLLDNPNLKWPHTYVKKGAIVLDDIDRLLSELKDVDGDNGEPKEGAKQLSLFA